MNFEMKKTLPHMGLIVFMFIVASIYFSPAWEGKSLQGTDASMNYGKFRERVDFLEYEDEFTMWNGGMFGGMPEYLSTKYEGADTLLKLWNLPSKLGIPLEVISLFWYFLGFYILLLAFGVNPWLSALGAIGFGFTSYNLIIIEAAHYMKVHTIAFIPPTLGGIYLCLRRKFLWGGIITAFFLALQINMKHVQMTYYFILALICIGIVELIFYIRHKKIKECLPVVGVLLLSLLMAVSINFAKLSNIYRYSQQSIRGGTELTLNQHEGNQKGLDKDYINSWSSGVSESMMLFAPNVKGGKTGLVQDNKSLYEKIPNNKKRILGRSNQYWGDQPFSGGPSYVGSLFFLFFLIGLFAFKDRIGKGIFAAVILLVMLSFGRHFPALTDIFIDYFPLYDKFRAPVSILAIVAILVVAMGTISINEMRKRPELLLEKRRLPFFRKDYPIIYMVGLIFILFLLINMAFPTLFNSYISDVENQQFSGMIREQGIGAYINDLTSFRIGVFRRELLRSLIFCVLGMVLLFLYAKKKIAPGSFAAVLMLLALVDVTGVGLRYVNKSHFKEKGNIAKAYVLTPEDQEIYTLEMSQNPKMKQELKAYNDKFTPKTPVDKDKILRHIVNKNIHYRVFNMTKGPFQETHTTNAHRSVGGYHAAKLNRYQELIEYHISKLNMNVLNMLNTKYFITQEGLQINNDALGAAWFVDSIIWVDSANDEILALNDLNPAKQTVINTQQFNDRKELDHAAVGDTIKMTEYDPHKIVYQSRSKGDRFAVFSDVFYEDWELYIDGEQSSLARVNYVLRGAYIPAGTHKIELIFNPKFYNMSNQVTQILLYIFIAIILVAIYFSFRKNCIQSGH